MVYRAHVAGLAALLLCLLDTPQQAESGMASLFRIHSLRDVFVNLVLQMKLELLGEVQLSLVLVKNRPKAKRHFVIPAHAFAPYGVSNTNSMAKESRFHCASSWRRYFAPSGVSE